MQKRHRLFFALWPDDIIRQRCAGIINAMVNEATLPVRAANIHVTLLFLGNISTEIKLALLEHSSSIIIPDIKIEFDRLSFWKKPKILCLTSQKSCSGLKQLNQDLTALVKTFGIQTELRPYKPHITLIKNVSELTAVKFEPIIWRTNSFCLIQSHPENNGIRYEVLKQWR